MNMCKRFSYRDKILASERGALLTRSRCIRGSMMQGIPIRESQGAESLPAPPEKLSSRHIRHWGP